MKQFVKFITHNYAAMIVVLVFVLSMAKVILVNLEQQPDNSIIIRIGHWQLEPGVRDGINKLAEEYRKTHPNVRIYQEAIPESAYSQWLSTQFIGGTAPDIVEMGSLPYQIMISFYNRYVYQLTPFVDKPNPYNKGTEFADTSWRNTFRDGLSNGYINELQEYMAVPMAGFSLRVFYNKTLLKKITGSAKPPASYGEFMAACHKIQEYKGEEGQTYTPIVGSKYHFAMWQTLPDTLTYRLLEKADFNRDGGVSSDELFVAVKNGRVSFSSDEIQSWMKMMRELSEQCQVGFIGLSRDEGVFLFAQQKAVFISTGTWDAGSLMSIAQGKFELGTMLLPMPQESSRQYGRYAIGPRYDNPGQGANFVVTRQGKHPEAALDFLHFMTSKRMNEEFNKIAGWIPSIRDTETYALLSDFKPNYFGIYSNFNPNLGGETYIRWMQLSSLYLVGQISREKFAQEFETFYKERGYTDYLEFNKDWQRALWINERFLTALRLKAMGNMDNYNSALWGKYRVQTDNQQLNVENKKLRQNQLVSGKKTLPAFGPYEYSPQALQNIRSQIENKP